MRKILLLRHGLTEANEKSLYCGYTDISLTDKGKNELLNKSCDYKKMLFGDKKSETVNVKYFTSGMKRTNETLELLFDTRNYVVLPGFKEMNFGIFEMHSYEELKELPEYVEWISGDFYSNVPRGGESGNQMRKRVVDSLHSLLSELEKEPSEMIYVLVCHGGVIAAIMEYLFPKENKNLYEWQPLHGCGYMIEFSKIPKFQYFGAPY